MSPLSTNAAPAFSLSPELTAAAVEAASELVLLLERCGDRPNDIVIRGANGAFQAATGYDAPELLDRPLTLLVAGPAVPRELLAALRAGVAQRTEMVCRRRDGEAFWLGLHLVPVPQAGPGRFVILGRDITRRRRQDEQHHAVESLLAKVFMTVEAGVIIVGADGVVLMANPYIHRVLRMPADGMVGQDSLDFCVAADRPRMAEARRCQLVEGGDYTVSMTLLAADGTEIPATATAAMVEREDLPHFRVLTIIPAPPPPPRSAPPTRPLRVQIAGKVQLVGLEEVRASLGDTWPQRAQRAMDAAEHVLRRSCGPGDTFARSGSCSFVVRFAQGTEEEAAFRAAMIARDIRHRLIGRGEPEATSYVTAMTTSVAVPIPEPTTAGLSELVASELTRRAGDLEAAARACIKEAARHATCVSEPVRTRNAAEPTARFLRLAPASERRIAAALGALPEQEAAAFDPDGLLLDLAAADQALRATQGDRSLVFVDVRFGVFTNRPCTERYLANCRGTKVGLRQTLTLVLTEIPPGVPGARLLECAGRLKPFCMGIGFQADSFALPFAELSFAGNPIMVVPAELCGPPGVVLPKLRRLISTVHAHRSRLLVRGVVTSAAAEPLLAAGVDMVSFASPQAHTSPGADPLR